METKTELTIPTTYEGFCTELRSNRFLGAEMPQELKDQCDLTDNPLIFAINLMSGAKIQLANPSHSKEMLDELKRFAAQLDTIIKDAINTTDFALKSIIEMYCGLKLALADSNHPIDQVEIHKQQEKIFEAIIKDGFNTFSAKQLGAINFGKKRTRKIFLLNQLVEFGAEELFYHAFEKLKGELSLNQLNQIIKTISKSYCGAETAEELNLASSLLKRGDHCFVRMFNFLLESVMKQNKLAEMLNGEDTNEKVDLKNYLKPIEEQIEEHKNEYTEKKYIIDYSYKKRKDNISQDLLTNKAKEEYKKYIVDTNGQPLIFCSTYNSIKVQIIIDDLITLKNNPSLNSNQKQFFGKSIIKEKQTSLNSESQNLLQSMLEYKIANKELDFLQYQDINDERKTAVINSPKSQPQLTKQQQLLSQFFRKYDEKLAEDKTAWCGLYGFFATSNANRSMSLLGLTQHAQDSGKRSLQVMKELNWLDEDNQLTNEIRMFVS